MMQIDASGNLITSRPSSKPMMKPLSVAPEILNKVWVFKFCQREIILVMIHEEEYDFQAKELSPHEYQLTFRVKDLFHNMRYTGDYVFGDPVKVIGMASDHDKYMDLVNRVGKLPEQILILERIKSIYD